VDDTDGPLSSTFRIFSADESISLLVDSVNG
jgi:hypothetical protein